MESRSRTPESEFKKIAEKIGFNPEHIQIIDMFMWKIAKHESSNNYGARGPRIKHQSIHKHTQAMTAWQFMPERWRQESKEIFGEILPPTPENQEKMAFQSIARVCQESIHR